MASRFSTDQLIDEARRHDVACVLLSNGFADPYGRYEVLAGFGAGREYTDPNSIPDSPELKLGFASYDLKNRFEKLESRNPALIQVPDLYFFEPRLFYSLDRDGIEEGNLELNESTGPSATTTASVEWHSPKAESVYSGILDQIRDNIVAGDFYEMNFCLQVQALPDQNFDPYTAFLALNRLAPAPFAAFFKYHDRYLLCASPERFLQREGESICSQPIKGTRSRAVSVEDDRSVVAELLANEKDRAENIMIVDLVRNDLSRICTPGSVQVPELCRVHSYSHVHQMTSTVCGRLQPGKGFGEILQATFPMGSMTGAPKIEVMKYIDEYEDFRRGWYSGSVGYVQGNDMDLNVVIRALQYDASKNFLACHAGGAIVFDSVPSEEYEECLSKAKAMRDATLQL